MSFLSAVGHWFTTASNWSGSDGIIARAIAQIELSAAVLVAAAIVGITIGYLLAHANHGAFLAVNASNAARAVPSLALLTLLVTWPLISLKGNGFDASFLALIALAIPPILTNAYIAMREVDREPVEAANAMGMTPWQRLIRVELPLALPLTVAGFRTAAVEVVATSTLAAYVSYSDLGNFIFAGLNTNNDVESFCGAILVAVLSGCTDALIYGIYRLVTPAPLLRSSYKRRRRTAATAVVA